MGFEVKIGVTGDAGAKQAIKGVGDELARTEQKAKQSRDSLGRWVGGAQQAANSSNKLTASVGSLSLAIDKLQRAPLARAIEGITGPALAATGTIIGLSTAFASLNVRMLAANDTLIGMSNRLRSLGDNPVSVNFGLANTRGVADRSFADWKDTNELYVRLGNATKDLGLSQARTLGLTETITKAFSMSGATAAEASASMLQLSQAFASGKLQGDEFRSLSESMPFILDLIAKTMGVTRGELKKLGSEGQITADVMVRAFEMAASGIESSFNSMDRTFEQKMTKWRNQLIDNPLMVEKQAIAANQNPFSALDTIRDTPGGLQLAQGFVPDSGGTMGLVSDILGNEATPAVRMFNDELSKLDEMIKAVQSNQPAEKMFTFAEALEHMARAGAEVNKSNPYMNMARDSGLLITAEDRVKALRDALIGLHGVAKDVSSGFGGAMLDIATRAGLVDPWNPTRNQDALAKMRAKPKAAKAPDKDPTNIWDGWLIDQIIGAPDARSAEGFEAPSTAIRNIIDDAKEQLAGLNAWAAAGEEQGFFARMIDQGEIFVETVKRQQAELTAAWHDEMRKREAMESPFEKSLDAVLAQATDVAGAMQTAFSNAYRGIEDSLVKLVQGQKISWRSLVDSILADLSRLAIRQLLFAGLSAAGVGIPGMAAAGGIVGAGGKANGGTWTAPNTGGGPDSVPMFARVSPGETVRFEPTHSTGGSSSGGGGGGMMSPTVVLAFDHRALAPMMQGQAFSNAVVDAVRKNPAAFRAALGG